MTKVFVIGVTAPKVLHSESQWAVTVIYTVKQRGYVKKLKKEIFCSYKPELYSWIECRFL